MLAVPPTPVASCRWALPEPADADESGLVGFGADLEPTTLVAAYRNGLFPWPHDDVPLPWFSPDPRAVIPTGGVRVTRSLRRQLARSGWTATVDAAFAAVVDACAAPRPDGEGTWVTAAMRGAYRALHELGWAHSVEVWAADELVGGLYGVQVGGCFTGESMFHHAPDASKAALVELDARFSQAGGALIDCQMPTNHLESLGARAVDRPIFLDALAQVRDDDVRLAVDRLPVSRLTAP
ncbi:MAG: leucyl/phenylalanyl-tRNA--protein transferase [Acidimicrobiales bacterium]|nr:leucyl/phenylalanyl-tRNA--protein transferase [Acidimicrobiales bacterium]